MMENNKFPVLKTERLILNRPIENDLEDLLLHMNSNKDISENTLTIPYPYTKESADFWFKIIEEGFQQRNAFIFAVRQKEIEKLMGAVGIHLDSSNHKAEVGYWIGKDFRGEGYISEALKKIINFGFEELKLNKIYASHFLHNPASGKVLINCGMQWEGTQKQHIFKNGQFLDLVNYGLLRESFGNS